MSQRIAVTDALFPSLDVYYRTQSEALLKTTSYVVKNCTLGDSFGVLLQSLKGPYEHARDTAVSSIKKMTETLDHMGARVEGYKLDVQKHEDSTLATIASLQAQVADLQSQANTGHASSGGGSGSGGGGGYRGPSGSITPPAPAAQPATPAEVPPPVAAASAVPPAPASGGIEGGAGTTTAPPPAGTTPSDPLHPVTPLSGPTPPAGAPTVVAVDPATAAQDAQQAARYQQFWREQATADPLGRTADQLREAWEAREPITFDSATAASNALGYGSTDKPLITAQFTIIVQPAASTSHTVIGVHA